MPTRRSFLGGLGALGAIAAGGCGRVRARFADRDLAPPGRIVGAALDRGHLLRAPGTTLPQDPTLACDTVVIGAGISGLSAAARLDAGGRGDFLVCELADESGGNAVAGAGPLGAYPWGAHYVPVPDPADEPLCRFFHQLGLIRSFGPDGLPVYDEESLCADPDERLWINGAWQEGFVPTLGVDAPARAQARHFLGRIPEWQSWIGADGLPAFALPLDRCSQDPRIEALHAETFAAWLDREGYRSGAFRWYLDYCCRDDFGAPAAVVSAWAGLHYFAARRGRGANARPGDVLTWPEGNAYLARALARGLGARLRTGVVVDRLVRTQARVRVEGVDVGRHRRIAIDAGAAILAVPAHVAARIDPQAAAPSASAVHTPWAVANVTVGRRPRGIGAPLSWDNVKFGSRLLGYVVADHQRLAAPRDELVLTCYWPLDHRPPPTAREWAMRRAHHEWTADFVGELLWLHPELAGHVEQADVWLWGHGMASPVPGFATAAARRTRTSVPPPVFPAHTDLSGVSVFEEAFALGRAAAERRLAWQA